MDRWYLCSVRENCTIESMLADIANGQLAPKVDLSWADQENPTFFVAVTSKDLSGVEDLLETSGNIVLNDLLERNHRIFIFISLRKQTKMISPLV